jgi:hypothetical protein
MSRRLLYRQDSLPVFQNKMFDSREEARSCSTGSMLLVQDDKTGLIFNEAFEPDLLCYDDHYQNEQACSGVFKQHLNEVLEVIHRGFSGKALIELGCGKGYFLEQLRVSGFEAVGVDPAYEGSSPHVIKSHFKPELGVSANGLILRHVLEHIPDPLDFLQTVKVSNGGEGTIYIEVPCFDWICRHRAWFDIFYEHVNYFRLDDFSRMFGEIHEHGYLFGGQYLYVVADLASFREPKATADSRVDFPRDFLGGIQKHAELISSTACRCAVWGGASKGVIFTLYMERAGRPVDAVIDINPAKQGKYIACTGLPVSSPEVGLASLRPGDLIFVMNSNYLDEIISQSLNKFTYVSVDNNEF